MKLALAADPRIFDRGDQTVILGRDGVARQLDGDSARLARAILDFVVTPRDRAEIFAQLEALVGGPVEPAEVVDELLALLREAGVLVEVGAGPAAREATPVRARRRLVLGLTGAVGTIRAPELVARLLESGFDVEVAMTRDARRFTTALGLEAITHRRVYRSLWQRDPARPVPHIQLAEWAELVLICPASATTVARIANGDCSCIVSAIAIATRAPVVVVPSMNLLMLSAPSVERNLEQLRSDGFHVVRTGRGVEAARAPGDRTVVAGPGASFDAVVEMARFIVDRSPLRDGGLDGGQEARSWESLYAATPTEELPWFTEEIDPDLGAALDRLGARAGRFLDLGCGPGTVALAMARRGLEVTATDLSPTAIARARARPGADAVRWVVDDAIDSRLDASFDLVHDRGCLHTLPRAQLARYASSVARLVSPGGVLLLKTHRLDAPNPEGTLGFDPLAVATLFGASFDLIHSEPSEFHGPRGATSPALFCILRRKP